jgi:hypothetical protein
MKTPLHVLKFPDKNFMLAFESDDLGETWSYNQAILEVMRKHNLNPFHQIGATRGFPNEPGFHAFEAWSKITEDEMQKLIPLVEEKAAEFIVMW